MSTYEISKSSLLSLKAEILRKQEELTKFKAENEVKKRNLKKKAPLELKNKNIEERQKNDTEEDENLLKKSREALEAKSRLYDRLSKNPANLTEEEQEYNRRYLVRFDRKSRISDLPPEDDDDVDRYPSDEDVPREYDPPKNPDEEWVEYVDCLGRTRTCLRKDLNYLKSNDKDLKVVVESRRRRDKSKSRSPSPVKEKSPELTEDNELLSSDMRRELLRRQWEREEEELRDKGDIHYQDILFNEARTHGVGYYAFSKDEEERAKQQEALNRLRNETKLQQKKADEMKQRREKQLAARIKAAKNRKRARLGLPPEEEEPEPESVEPAEKVEEKQEATLEDKKLEEKRKKHIRPWDLGKKGVKEHYEYSQEEWVDRKRKERPKEFAPPEEFKRKSFRSEVKREIDEPEHKSLKFSTKKDKQKRIPIANECEEFNDDVQDYEKREEPEEKRGKRTEIAPPPTYDYYGPSGSKRARNVRDRNNVGDSIEAGLKFLRQQMEKKETKSRKFDMFD